MPSHSNPPTARSGVFISYARCDGEKFASDLRQRLEKAGIPLWQDRVCMEGGRDWWLQITEALDHVEFMALVITPNALKSDTVRKEWRYARQQGVCVYPIKGAFDLDFNNLPRWMRSVHFYDLEHEWQRFVNDLNTRCQQNRVPFMVEDLPEGFVPRPGEFDQLLKLLIDERREEPVAITAALRGAGGYGKTTLAKALCHDERIQEAFDDGILWVTLGEKPGDLTGRVEDLIVTLGNERPGFTTPHAAVNRLKELLADRDILIVIDDVWDRAHLNPFIQGGPRCARLITTRNFDTLPAAAKKVQVDAMRRDEATALLAVGLDQEDGPGWDLTLLASRLGEWPLLLRLVNSALRNRIENDHQSPRDTLTWVNRALDRRGLAYFDARNSDERHQAVARTIGVSLDLLSAKDRERYCELAIFPEDVEIPLDTLEKLWRTTGRLDKFETEELCSQLNSFSLLWSYDATHRRIRLHDVVRKFLIEHQGDKLRSIHAQLLDAHQPVTFLASFPRWSEMSTEEPYLWDHLAPHLIDAGRGDELVATVKDGRYLVAKTLRRKSLAVESDIVLAETVTDDNALPILRRTFVDSGHVFNRCDNRDDLECTLVSRLRHLHELNSLTFDLEQNLRRPYLVPAIRLPDLPHSALVHTLTGHVGPVSGCAVSADKTTIVSASWDHTLKVWDGQSGAERFALIGHVGVVRGCAVSADGTTIVSASDDKTLKVWDRSSGAERSTLSGHASGVRCCAVSADGSTIISASEDHTVRVWDRIGAERFTLRGHAGVVNGCAVSADGATIISASDDNTLKVWDGKSGTERFTLTGHVGRVSGCSLSADGATIVSASWDQTLKVWDAQSGAVRFTLSGHTGGVLGCAVSADGATIISASWDMTIKIWDGHSGTERFTFGGHLGRVRGCAVSPDATTIISASDDQTLKVWDWRSGPDRSATGHVISGGSGWVRGCAVSADGAMIVSASRDHTLKVWDGLTATERFILNSHTEPVNGCAVSADGTTIISASDDKTLKVWDGRTGVERFTLSGHASRVFSCAVSADGATIVSASSDQTLKVWDGRSGTNRFTLSGHVGWVFGCAISADGCMIVSASADGTLGAWDGQTGVERLKLRGHAAWVNGCAISANGGTIVSVSADGTLKVWDGQTGAERFRLRGHAAWVNGCAVTADGAMIISASQDGKLKLWDGRTGECLSTLFVDGPLEDCACSVKGEIVAAGGARGIYFFRLIR
jgi:WD40 repeat protein